MKNFLFLFLVVFTVYANAQVVDTLQLRNSSQVYYISENNTLDSVHILDYYKKLKYQGSVNDSIIELYDMKGNLYMQTQYKNNRINGIAYIFRPNGRIYKTGTYKDGIEDGMHISFDENMKPQVILEYENGKGMRGISFKNGVMENFRSSKGYDDPTGQTLEFHDNGVFKKVRGIFDFEYDENGNPIKQ